MYLSNNGQFTIVRQNITLRQPILPNIDAQDIKYLADMQLDVHLKIKLTSEQHSEAEYDAAGDESAESTVLIGRRGRRRVRILHAASYQERET